MLHKPGFGGTKPLGWRGDGSRGPTLVFVTSNASTPSYGHVLFPPSSASGAPGAGRVLHLWAGGSQFSKRGGRRGSPEMLTLDLGCQHSWGEQRQSEGLSGNGSCLLSGDEIWAYDANEGPWHPSLPPDRKSWASGSPWAQAWAPNVTAAW